ncbi:hypothetical protein [Streptomyces sp. MAI_2237]
MERWGTPEAVDLWPYFAFDDPDSTATSRGPLCFLCGVASSMQVWRLPSSELWVGLTIGQADPEWPFQLPAGIGETSSLDGG